MALILCAVLLLLLTDPPTQSLLFNALCLCHLVLHLAVQPYAAHGDNQMESLALFALLLLLLLLAQLLASESQQTTGVSLSLGVQLLAGSVLLVPLVVLLVMCAQFALRTPTLRAVMAWIMTCASAGRSPTPTAAAAGLDRSVGLPPPPPMILRACLRTPLVSCCPWRLVSTMIAARK